MLQLPFVWLSEGFGSLIFNKLCGGYFGGVTPVPIPNTEVKPTRADGTAREAVWESRSLPHLFWPASLTLAGLFHFPAARIRRRPPSSTGRSPLVDCAG